MSEDNGLGNAKNSHGAAILIAVITIVCLVPFLNKAFHIDDPLFLWVAKHIQWNPLNFYGFTVNWFGPEATMAEATKNPPGACFYIALVGWLFGWSEITMHTAFLVPAAAAAVGTYYLARRLCSRPIPAALAAVLTPAFLVSSTSIMCDTMMLAFWVWAVFLWIKAIETDSLLSLVFAAVLVAICSMTKYFGMSLLPLLAVYALIKKHELGYWTLALLIPVVVLVEYQWLTHSLYGQGLLLDAAVYTTCFHWADGINLLTKGFTGLIFAGGCVITALFCIPFLWSRRVFVGGFILTVALVVGLSFVKSIGKASVSSAEGVRWGFLVQVGLMAAGGVCILALAVADLWKFRNAESVLLLLWVYGTFIFAGVINWTVNARSILPMVPAVGILLMRRMDFSNDKAAVRTKSRWRFYLPLVPSALVAIMVCWADYKLADSARSAATAISNKFENSGRAVWFQGHWGFQYYMELEGSKAADLRNPEYSPGDVMILPTNNTNVEALPEKKAYEDEILQFMPCRWLATINRKLGAGFYSDVWGPLPFAVGPVGPEEYYVFVMK